MGDKGDNFCYEYTGIQLRIHHGLLRPNTQSLTLSRSEEPAGMRDMQVLASLMTSPTPSLVLLKHTSAHVDTSRTRDTEHLFWNFSYTIRAWDYEDQRGLHIHLKLLLNLATELRAYVKVTDCYPFTGTVTKRLSTPSLPRSRSAVRF